MKLVKRFFARILITVKYICNSNRAEMKAGDLPPFKIAEVIIGGTTYIVSLFFKKDAKGDVVDKISRLIERDAANISEK